MGIFLVVFIEIKFRNFERFLGIYVFFGNICCIIGFIIYVLVKLDV